MNVAGEHEFTVGDWRVQPTVGVISRDDSITHLEPKVMQVLVCLSEHAGEVVSKQALMTAVWADTFVTDQVLTHAIWQLRQVMGNGGSRSEIIETIPKKGYRLVSAVRAAVPFADSGATMPEPSDRATANKGRRALWTAILGGAAILLIVVAALARWRSEHNQSVIVNALAVLPLRNYSGDPAQEYFADAMTEELTTDLAKIPGLRVISRSSAMAFKDTRKTLPEIARELQVDAVVEGSVQRADGRVRITVQLISPREERHLWAQTYEHDFKDVLMLRDQAARAIAAEIRLNLSPEQGAGQPTKIVPEAYDAYRLGWYLADQGTREGYLKSIEYFQRAIQYDPGFAQAHAELAESYAMLDFTADLRGENFQRAQQAAQRAYELDPRPAEVQIRMADLQMFWDWDWSQCDGAFQRAARSNPGSADAQGHYAVCLFLLGRYERARPEMERAQQSDPLSPRGNGMYGAFLFRIGQYDAAIEQFRKAIDLAPGIPAHFNGLAAVYEALHRYHEAVAARLQAARLKGMADTDIAALEDAFKRGGFEAFQAKRRVLLEREAQTMIAHEGADVSPTKVAELYAAAGDRDSAFRWLNQAYARHSPRLVWLGAGLSWEPLRRDPRYYELLRRMKFPGPFMNH